jgi:hypothetical protein
LALSQKEKNIEALHAAAKAGGLEPLLEISSKSKLKTGRHMSAFHMTADTKELGAIKLELAFQGSKVSSTGDRSPTCTEKVRRKSVRRNGIRV